PVPSVMFPMLVKNITKGEKFHHLFSFALLIVASISGIVTLFYFLFPRVVITVFLGGGQYLSAIAYVGLFGLFATIFSLLYVCVNLFLSLKKTEIAFPLVGGAVLQAMGIWFFHTNFFEIISISIVITLVLTITLLLYYAKEYGAFKKT
ncbi:MAG: hypothetical protein ACREGI_04090, partial [Candidatus Levyibacteriota bacterium]